MMIITILDMFLVIVLFLNSFFRSAIYWYPNVLASLLNYLLVVVMLIRFYLTLKEQKTRRSCKAEYIYILFTIMYIVTILLNDNIISNMKYFVLTFIQLFIVRKCYIKSGNLYSVIVKLYIIIVFGVNIISLIAPLMGEELLLVGNIYCGLFTGPNIAAIVEGLLIVLVFQEFIKSQSYQKQILYTAIILSGVIMFKQMQSRAGILFVGSFFFLVIIFHFKSLFNKISNCILLALMVSVYVLATYNISEYINIKMTQENVIAQEVDNVEKQKLIEVELENMMDIETEESENMEKEQPTTVKREKSNVEESNHYRINLLKYGMKAVFVKPLLGIGVENIATKLELLAGEYLSGSEGGGVHNSYLTVFIANGILGGIMFVFIMCGTLKRIISFQKNQINLNMDRIDLTSYIVLSLMGYGLVESSLIFSSSIVAFMFWLFIGRVEMNE